MTLEQLLKPFECRISAYRAQEIIDSINRTPFGWERDISKDEERGIMTRDERRAIIEFWNHMPPHTCFYDAIYRIARGEQP